MPSNYHQVVDAHVIGVVDICLVHSKAELVRVSQIWTSLCIVFEIKH